MQVVIAWDQGLSELLNEWLVTIAKKMWLYLQYKWCQQMNDSTCMLYYLFVS